MGQAGGVKCLPLLLFGLGIVLVVDLQELLVYNVEQHDNKLAPPSPSLTHIALYDRRSKAAKTNGQIILENLRGMYMSGNAIA